jgi:hypothetical protein
LSNQPKLALSSNEVEEILRASENIAILVGGQALATWASFYQVAVPAKLTENVTEDADFIGTADTALVVKGGLSNKEWKFELIRPGSLSPVTAQLTLQSDDGVKEIDFLGSIVGVHNDDLRKRAVSLDLPGGFAVTVLHPLDVLASRLYNLAEIPEKRNDKGVAQAELAISIARAFLRDTIVQGNERVFPQIERLRMTATNDKIAAVSRDFGLDVLSCVPIELITNEKFKANRWPQIVREVETKVGTRVRSVRQQAAEPSATTHS